MNDHRIILTGSPGVGKTTIIKNVCNLLVQSNIPICGFYTEEVRKNNYRIGFDIVSVDGNRGRLARIAEGGDGKALYTVGKYQVLLKEFDSIQDNILGNASSVENGVVIIDEIGKMEMFSKQFVSNITKIFESNVSIIATIPIGRGKPIALVEDIRNDKRNMLLTVSNHNRNTIPSTISDIIINKYKLSQ